MCLLSYIMYKRLVSNDGFERTIWLYIIEQLLVRGAHPDGYAPSGLSPLRAHRYGDHQAVEVLLSALYSYSTSEMRLDVMCFFVSMYGDGVNHFAETHIRRRMICCKKTFITKSRDIHSVWRRRRISAEASAPCFRRSSTQRSCRKRTS